MQFCFLVRPQPRVVCQLSERGCCGSDYWIPCSAWTGARTECKHQPWLTFCRQPFLGRSPCYLKTDCLHLYFLTTSLNFFFFVYNTVIREVKLPEQSSVSSDFVEEQILGFFFFFSPWKLSVGDRNFFAYSFWWFQGLVFFTAHNILWLKTPVFFIADILLKKKKSISVLLSHIDSKKTIVKTEVQSKVNKVTFSE